MKDPQESIAGLAYHHMYDMSYFKVTIILVNIMPLRHTDSLQTFLHITDSILRYVALSKLFAHSCDELVCPWAAVSSRLSPL